MTWNEFDNYASMVFDYLDEYQQKSLNDAVSAFGYNEDTFNRMIYVWYGMELESFIDSVLE